MTHSTPTRLPTIGLAGGIGSGKSAAAAILAELGCLVADADRLARDALEDPRIKRTLIEWWGQRVVSEEGRIDRRAVAEIVFADPSERKRLEALTHPWVIQAQQRLFAAAPPGTKALVIDAPLLLEAGLDARCDAVIFVESDRSARLARLAATRGWDEAELARREESQLPLDAKRKRADYVVRNDGDLSDLGAQLRPILSHMIQSRRTEEGD